MKDRSNVFLAVDDRIENLISVKAIIKESFPDSVILTAQNGEEGLKIAREQNPDVILLDIMMPDMDGYDVCSVLKADPVLKGIPVIFLTALNSDRENRLKAFEIGAEAFIRKPIDELELHIQLRTLLRLRQYNVRNREQILNLEENLVLKGNELEKNKERFRLMVENISDTIGITDAEGNIKFRSSNNEKLFGIKSEELAGQNSFDFVHPDDRERLKSEFLGLIKDGSGAKRTGEFKYLCKDGSVVIVELEGRNMLDNEFIDGLLLTFHDITEKKAADRKTKEESEKLRALIESTEDLVWVVDPVEFGLMSFNHALSQYFITGRDLNIQVGMRPEDLLPDTYALEWISYYNKALVHGAYRFEYNTSANNRTLELSFYPVKIESELIGISVIGQDITERKKMENELRVQRNNLISSNVKLETLLQQSINAISRIAELRDVYTAGHQDRVAKLACAIAQELGLPEATITNISFGARVHDIGKIYIASDILNKPGKLSSLEHEIIQTHSEQGYEVVKEIDFPSQIKTMIYQHHERLDGSGYPQRLVGDQIIIESRILAVADVVEAMTSHRPYRPALGIDEALEELQSHKTTKYDSDVVNICLKLFRENLFEF
jgi:PAS domain S-box-containing protein/putative nucleotidyltransferase with HDIG domain